MEEVWVFDFENAHWVCKKTQGGLSVWQFCHATKRGDKIYVVGATDGADTDHVEVRSKIFGKRPLHWPLLYRPG